MKDSFLSERDDSHVRETSEKLEVQDNNQIKQFDWSKRWLKGDEYTCILRNIDLYCKKFGFQKFSYKEHPQSIYKSPINGLIYFVQGKGVGSDFGFPRVNGKKRYRWKKMNFTTDIPKKKPQVTYVVASAMKANTMQTEIDLPDFRMHAVIPYTEGIKKNESQNEYILCHVREVEHKKFEEEEEQTLQKCFLKSQVDFFKLFCYLKEVQNLKPEKQSKK